MSLSFGTPGAQLRKSTTDIVVEITDWVAGAYEDPSQHFVGYLSFKPSRYDDEPGEDFTNAEWHQAAWETGHRRYLLTVLLGPRHSGIVLARGRWHVFAGLDGPIEAPLLYAGSKVVW